MAEYLFYKCEHLCMWIFRVPIPSSTKTKYIYCI